MEGGQMGWMDGRRGGRMGGWLDGWMDGRDEKDKGQGRQGEGEEWIVTEQSRDYDRCPGHFPSYSGVSSAIWEAGSHAVLFLQAGGPELHPVCQQRVRGWG